MVTRAAKLATLVMLASAAAATACNSILGLDEKGLEPAMEAGPSVDSGDATRPGDAARETGDGSSDGGDTALGDASDSSDAAEAAIDASDAGDAADAPFDAPTICTPVADGGTVYHDFTNSACWSSFDTSNLALGPSSYTGSVFDGRYVYMAPGDARALNAGIAVRYDTTQPFGQPGSWGTYMVDPIFYVGAVFDGRYVYMVPYADAGGNLDGRVVRFDTTLAFTDPSAWVFFDTASFVSPNAAGYDGATFDGRYIYFVPLGNPPSTTSGLVVRYDSTAPFATVSSWSTFDLQSLNTNAAGFLGAVFDGRYVYFAPSFGLNSAPANVAAAYDTQMPFTSAGAWTLFDTSSVNMMAAGFQGAATDGQYLYLVPNAYELLPTNSYVDDGLVVRHDLASPFGSAGSWSTFDVTQLDTKAVGFLGADFDGRFVYFVPNDNGMGTQPPFVRYDTQASFGAATSWSSTYPWNVPHNSYAGAVFDGRFMYFVPDSNGIVARFDARVPPSLPGLPAFHGSFL